MVHALEEAWRVLRPDGLLLDLRPAMVHRRVGIIDARGCTSVGVMRERFDDDILANRAIARALRQGLFRRGHRERIDCTRSMDTIEEFRSWLDAYVSLEKLPSHAWLLSKVDRALATAGKAPRIVVEAPLELQVLEKRDTR